MLLKIFHLIKGNKILTGSFIVLSGGLLGSFTNYLYHLLVGRILGPKDYGILDSLISLIYLLNVFLSTIILVITKYVSTFKGQGRYETIKSFYLLVIKKLFILSLIALIFFLFSTPLVVSFLHLPSPFLYFIVWLSFILSLYSTLTRSFLQGLSKFLPLTIANLLENFFRLFITLILLFLGYKLIGAVLPFLFTAVISIFVSYFLTKNLHSGAKPSVIPEKKEIIKYIFPVFLTNIGITSLISTDIILARHYLSPHDAGLYSALSTLSKIIFFTAAPVVSVLFPSVSEAHSAQIHLRKTINTCLALISSLIILVLIPFAFFPQIIAGLLFGEKFQAVVPYLPAFSIGMGLYTIDFTLANILLALKKTSSNIYISGFALLQIVLIIFFHSKITDLVSIFILITSLLCFFLLLSCKKELNKITKTVS